MRLVDTQEGLAALEADWEKVLSSSGDRCVFLSHEWIHCWWEAFGRGKQLRVLVLHDAEGAAMAIAPLMLDQRRCSGMKARTLSFIYDDNASHADFIVRSGRTEECLGQFLDHFRQAHGEWDMAELPALRTDSPQFTVLCDLLRARKFIFGIKPGNISPFIDLTRYQGWEGYLASRSKKFRKTLRNCLNRLERDSRLHVDEIGDIRSDPAVMQGVFAISRRSWKGSCHRDMAGGAESQRFYELLSTIASQRGWLRLWLLKVNGAPAAYEFALQFKETLFPLRADFDSVYKEFTPGTILHSGAVQDCFTRGLRELDFCGNDDGYKLRWTELERRHATIVIYNRTPLGILLYCWDYCFVHRIKHFLRRFTILRKLKKFYTRHD